MKKTILALTVAGLLAGCSKSPSPAAPATEPKPMHPAVSQLDLDGDFILFADTSTIEKSVLNTLDEAFQKIVQLGEPDADELAQANAVLNNVKSGIIWSGLLSVDSFATSTKTLDSGLERNISCIGFSDDDAQKAIWRILASEPVVLQGIDFAPADAVYTVNSTASLDELWNVLNEALSGYFPEEQQMQITQQLAMVEMMLGVKLDDLLGSLDPEILVSLQLSESKQCNIPIEGKMLAIPEPNLIIGLKTKDSTVADLILAKLQGAGVPTEQSQQGGYTLNTIQIPLPAPFPVAPTLVQTEDYLLIGSSPAAIVAALDSKANENGLVASPLYRKLLADAPEKTSGIEFLSPRFMQAYMDIMKQSMGSDMGQQGPDIMNLMFGGFENIQCGSYMLKTPTGLYSKGYGDSGGAKPVEMAATAYIGMISAIAVPSFHKARSNSQDKMCINNRRILDAAKEQWAMENAKVDGDAVTEADVGKYIKGGYSALQCPKGGTYTIAPVGSSPSCSVHGSMR